MYVLVYLFSAVVSAVVYCRGVDISSCDINGKFCVNDSDRMVDDLVEKVKTYIAPWIKFRKIFRKIASNKSMKLRKRHK